jgi:hypothetical protein
MSPLSSRPALPFHPAGDQGGDRRAFTRAESSLRYARYQRILDAASMRVDSEQLETNKTSGFYQGTEIAVDQFVAHVIAMK